MRMANLVTFRAYFGGLNLGLKWREHYIKQSNYDRVLALQAALLEEFLLYGLGHQ